MRKLSIYELSQVSPFLLLFLVLLTLGAMAEAAKPADLKAGKVQQLFNYPFKIECETKTVAELRETNDYRQMGELEQVTSCKDKDLLFAPVTIAYYKGGTFLTEEKKVKFNQGITEYNAKMETMLKEAKDRVDPTWSPEQKKQHLDNLEKVKEESRKYVPARVFKTNDGREGYSFVAGFGPGGSAMGSAVLDKKKQHDIFVQVFFPSDGVSLKKTEKTAIYFDYITNNYFDVLESVVSNLGG